MNVSVTTTQESLAQPSSASVRFLRSYANNLTLFDEFVTDALVKAMVKPITLLSPLLEKTRRICG